MACSALPYLRRQLEQCVLELEVVKCSTHGQTGTCEDQPWLRESRMVTWYVCARSHTCMHVCAQVHVCFLLYMDVVGS